MAKSKTQKVRKVRWVNPLKTGERQKYLDCIKVFYKYIRPKIMEISSSDAFRHFFGGDVNSLGYEGGLEATIKLFEQGQLRLCAKDKDDFTVILVRGRKLTVLYDSKEHTQDDSDGIGV